ncbi:amine sulfotransferase-like [Clavelina lepadiformis]|uniref:amine sulfotransferase-like n=1 Tax=Clavelina lepadiformis TaxID=159417 RepID=UPI00404383C0
MEQMLNMLPPEMQVLMKQISLTDFPQNPKSKSYKGHNFIPMFSPEVAEYAYDKMSVKEGDVYIVSYPKTGTNWTYEIIRQMLYRDSMSEELSKRIPLQLGVIEMEPCEKFALLDKLPLQRRIMGSHLPAELVNVDRITKANAKIVYVYRNPKDQIVSWLKFASKLPVVNEEPMKSMLNSGWDKYFEHVVAGDFPMNMKPGQWYPDHILGWYKHRDNKNVHFACFEEMKQDLPREIKKLADFLDVSLSNDEVDKITEACTFANMKKNIATDGSNRSKILDINMRKGEVGGWKNYFTVAQSERVDTLFKEKLAETDIRFTY